MTPNKAHPSLQALQTTIAHAGKLADHWRQQAARESVGGQAALARWRDLNVRVDALRLAADDNGLRVAVMGRVKAGKSTLLNGLVNRQVAAVHVFEQSAAIHSIRLVDEAHTERARLTRRDGQVEEMSPEELVAVCRAHQEDKPFWTGVDGIETLVHRGDLPAEVTFFDTPGVASLRGENGQLAVDFLGSAHVVLWVQSGQNIGNADDKRFLEEIVRRGQPVLPVFTRADLLEDDEQEDVCSWFVEQFPTLPVPMLVAANQWSKTSEERRKLITAIVAFTPTGTGRDLTSSAREHSILESLALDTEAAAAAELSDIDRLSSLFAHVDIQVDMMQQRVLAAVEVALDAHIKRAFDQEWHTIQADVLAEVARGARGDDTAGLVFQRHLNDERMRTLVVALEDETRQRLTEEWGRALEQALVNLGDQVKSLMVETEHTRLTMMRADLGTRLNNPETYDKATKALMGGAAAATAYAAWFGASAASVSLGAALTGVGLPILAIGWLALGWKKRRDQDRAKSETLGEANRLMDDLRRRFDEDLLRGQFLPALRRDIDQVGRRVGEMLVHDLTGGVARDVMETTRVFFEQVAAGNFAQGSSQDESSTIPAQRTLATHVATR